MRGVLRYRRDDVVAILDSTRAGESESGVPIVGAVDDASADPRVALVGVATQGGRFRRPGASSSAPASAVALDRERAPRDARRRPGAATARRRGRCRAARPAPASGGPGLHDGRKPRGRRDDRADRRLRLRDREDDRLARARPRGAARGLRSVFVPTGQTGIAIAGWGIAVVVSDFLGGAAEELVVEGATPRRRAAAGRGARVTRPPCVLGCHTRPLPRLRAARARPLPPSRRDRDRGRPGHPIPPLAELVELHERMALPVARRASSRSR